MTEVAVLSTGVIGVPLPMERILKGADACMAGLSAANHGQAAEAIMTTDTVPKEMALEIPLSTGPVRLGSMAKGSGMIAPNMATMNGVITTDAAVAPDDLRALLKECVDRSFNCMCIDNDMSTSDAVLCMANGQAMSAPLKPGTEDFERFGEALDQLCVAMAQALVRDGEGATKFVEINVAGEDGSPQYCPFSVMQDGLFWRGCQLGAYRLRGGLLRGEIFARSPEHFPRRSRGGA